MKSANFFAADRYELRGIFAHLATILVLPYILMFVVLMVMIPIGFINSLFNDNKLGMLTYFSYQDIYFILGFYPLAFILMLTPLLLSLLFLFCLNLKSRRSYALLGLVSGIGVTLFAAVGAQQADWTIIFRSAPGMALSGLLVALIFHAMTMRRIRKLSTSSAEEKTGYGDAG